MIILGIPMKNKIKSTLKASAYNGKTNRISRLLNCGTASRKAATTLLKA
jgi:hypothetical protein